MQEVENKLASITAKKRRRAPRKKRAPKKENLKKPKKTSKIPEDKNSSPEVSSELSELPSDLEEYLTTQTGTSYLKKSKIIPQDSNNPNFCFLCNLSLSNQNELEAHMYFHKPQHTFKCEICGKAYKFKRSINKHTREVHADELRKRFSRRKSSKWLRTYFKTSKTEEKLFYAEMEKANMFFFEKIDSYSLLRLQLESDWISRELSHDSTMIYEEFYQFHIPNTDIN